MAAENSKLRQRGQINAYVILSCIMASSGGLMFGYNIGISGGVTSMSSFLERFFPDLITESHHSGTRSNNNNYCKFNDQGLKAFTSSLYIAGLVSTFAASFTSTRFGRKPTMLLAGLLFVLGVLLTSTALNLAMLIIGRIVLGAGTGFANQVGPMYLSEIAPTRLRGGLNVLFQLNLTIGILFANLVNYGMEKIQPWGWRLSFGLAGIPAAFLTLGSLVIVETPNSLIERGYLEEGKKTLQKIRGSCDVTSELDELVKASQIVKEVKNPFWNLLKQRNSPQLIISVWMQIFQQFTGINAIMFYGPAIFQALGFKSGASLYSAVITGVVNVLSCAISVVTVDYFGRRVLLLQGGVQMFISQVVVAIVLGRNLHATSGHLTHMEAIVVILMVCLFISGFAWSWGPMSSLIPSEIFPLESRSAGLSVVVFVNLLMIFTIAQAFLSMLCTFQYAIFLFFASWVLVMTIFVYLFIPETKNIPLDNTVHLWRDHWFWKRVVGITIPSSKQNCLKCGENQDHSKEVSHFT